MSRLDGGVYIASPYGLRGDIIPVDDSTDTSSKCSHEDHKEENHHHHHLLKRYVIRLRGSNGTEIPVNDSELVEYTSTHSPEQLVTKEEEDVRFHLSQMTFERGDEFFLQERMLAMELGDEFSYMLLSNSMEYGDDCNSSLPPDVEGSILIRLLEAYYVGQGNVVANGRHLNSFCKALCPFWKKNTKDNGYSPISGKVEEIFDQLDDIFGNAEDGLVVFRAFCYAHHRLDYHKQDDGDSLLDAYCVAFYVIKLLQGAIPGKRTNFAKLVDRELYIYGSGVEMTVDDIVWSFCILFLRIGTDVRRYSGLKSYNRMFPKPFDLSMNEELFACQLAMDLRPDSPVSYLPAYRMIMETKSLVPQPFQSDWLKTAHNFVERGLEAADKWGDPYFQYMFEMITAYWLPTTINEPNTYTLGQIESRINLANDLKKECVKTVPRYMFWMGEKHELSLRHLLKSHPIDRDVELSVALMDAFTYTPLHLRSGQNTTLPHNEHSCTHCSKTLQRRLHCGRCKTAHYCSRECQVAHWNGGHQKECLPVASQSSCGNCSTTLKKALMCSKCKAVGYCNRDCQVKHWKSGHKHCCQKAC